MLNQSRLQTKKNLYISRGGDGQVVVLAFISDYQSSKPAPVYNFYCVKLPEMIEKEAGISNKRGMSKKVKCSDLLQVVQRLRPSITGSCN